MIGGAFLPEPIVSALIVLGGAFAPIGSWGLVRLPSLMERLHGPAKATSISRPTISILPR
jgi:multicomponent K+:H+ antiporter subunit G